MKPFTTTCDYSPKKFKRETGLSHSSFNELVDKVTTYIDVQKENYPLSKRGKQDSKLSPEDHVLLTLYYLRHYPTFSNLADVFDISESYCCKIYHRYARLLIHVEKVANRKYLLDHKPETVIIDASEQPIERPVKRQRDYYSGKKKTYYQSPTNYLRG